MKIPFLETDTFCECFFLTESIYFPHCADSWRYLLYFILFFKILIFIFNMEILAGETTRDILKLQKCWHPLSELWFLQDALNFLTILILYFILAWTIKCMRTYLISVSYEGLPLIAVYIPPRPALSILANVTLHCCHPGAAPRGLPGRVGEEGEWISEDAHHPLPAAWQGNVGRGGRCMTPSTSTRLCSPLQCGFPQ